MLASAILAPYQSASTSSTLTYQTNSIQAEQSHPEVIDASEELAQAVNRYLLNQIGEQTRNYESLFERVLKGERGFDALVSAQQNAILWADMLNQPALLGDLKRHESMGEIRNTQSHRMALAEPLVERIRLAYLFVFSGDLKHAKDAIEDAAEVEVPWQALQVARVKEIFDGIRTLRDLMKLACDPNCIELLFQECDLDRDGLITPFDLELAKGRGCQIPQGVLSFLQTKSDLFGSAINRAELKSYLSSNWLYGAFKELIC